MISDASLLINSVSMVALSIFAAAMLIALVRLLRGPSMPDRVIALDLIATLSVGAIAVYSILIGQAIYLRAAMVLALVAFLGTVAFALYLEKRSEL